MLSRIGSAKIEKAARPGRAGATQLTASAASATKQCVNLDTILPVLAAAGTLLLVIASLLNFSVFVRQLRTVREQLQVTRGMLEHARQQPEIQLMQRAMTETSEHLKVLVERPYLRPYFYENKPWQPGDAVSSDEVKAMAELLLDNLASAVIHSAAFPEYPIRGVEQNIRFHLRNSPALREFLMEAFDRFPLAGLTLLSVKNLTREETEADLRHLIDTAQDEKERARRERLLRHLQTTEKAEPLDLAKYSFARARAICVGAPEPPAK